MIPDSPSLVLQTAEAIIEAQRVMHAQETVAFFGHEFMIEKIVITIPPLVARVELRQLVKL